MNKELYQDLLEYITPDPEILVVTITQTTPGGRDGIADDTFFLSGNRTGNVFKRGQFYLIWRQEHFQGKPLKVNPKGKKEKVAGWEHLPKNRDYGAWGRLAQVKGFAKEHGAFVIQDDCGFRYWCTDQNYKPVSEDQEDVPKPAMGDWIVFHRTSTTTESIPDHTFLEPVCWYPADEEGDGYAQYSRHLMAMDPESFHRENLDWILNSISVDKANEWRQMFHDIFVH